MSENYQVLALKWRPKQFKDVVGQDHITNTLQKAFEKNRIAQAFLFAGPRGVGKTTTARLVAMSLNGSDNPTTDFDLKSESVKDIVDGKSMDVIEIDGASNRGIDEIRELESIDHHHRLVRPHRISYGIVPTILSMINIQNLSLKMIDQRVIFFIP